MLQWRAITACARLACPEALYGVVYTPDEMAELPDTPAVVTVAEALGGEVIDAEVVDDTPSDEPEHPATPRQKAALDAQIKRLGIGKDAYLGHATDAAGRMIGGTSDLTEIEAGLLLDKLAAFPDPTSGLAAAKAALHGEQGGLA